jgi:hypothetical protein
MRLSVCSSQTQVGVLSMLKLVLTIYIEGSKHPLSD